MAAARAEHVETNEAQPRAPGAGAGKKVAAGPVVRLTGTVAAADLEQGTWIVVLRASEIPHVVMLQAGTCYSLETDGNRRYPVRKLWRLVEAKRIPTLFCELGSWAAGPVAAAYARHAKIEGEGDCFLPVQEYCASWLADCAACAFPYELVPRLSSGGRLARAVLAHLGEGAEWTSFTLPVYSRADIRRRIAEVRDVRG
ncbi:MAG TPA: hypothetical protein VF530_14085 [Planctomycetota bacterium]